MAETSKEKDQPPAAATPGKSTKETADPTQPGSPTAQTAPSEPSAAPAPQAAASEPAAASTPASDAPPPIPQTTQPSEDAKPPPLATPGSAETVTVAPQPLELAASSQKEDVGAFKKLFWKINEKVGKTKTSEFSQEYMTAVTEFDTYNAMLKDLNHAVTSIIQHNHDYVPDEGKSKNSIEAPASEDPYEMLAKAIDVFAPVSIDKKELSKAIDTAKKVASHHREYQQKARRSFHQIRTFLKVDYEFMNVERTEVVKCRQNFDIATYELEKNPGSSWKRSGVERARKAYDVQCRKVIDFVKEMGEKRAQHRIELLRFLQEYRNFNELAAKEFEKYAAVLAKLPPISARPQSPSNSSH